MDFNFSDHNGWNGQIKDLPSAHILQTWEWGRVKSEGGWLALPKIWHTGEGQPCAAALVLERKVEFAHGLFSASILYVPRGPLLNWNDVSLRIEVLKDLENLARQRNAIFIKIDPEIIVGTEAPQTEQAQDNPESVGILRDIELRGWNYSPGQVQFRNTVWLDLTGSESDWLARMKQKTRYNLRLAERKGVTVRSVDKNEFSLLYRMYAETAVRDDFVIRPEDYYLRVWSLFKGAEMAEFLIAEVEGQPVGGLVLFMFGERAWYLYGMSSQQHREKMPNYLLQWEAMKRAKVAGCKIYDLWGAPDIFDESDSMWGVFRFKEGLGGTTIRTAGAWDFPAKPFQYRLYTRILPKILGWMRRRGKTRTAREVSP